MARAISAAVSAHFERVHRDAGVSIRCNAAVCALHGESGRVSAVELAGGERVGADLVVVGIGVVPDAELAQRAGLAVANGIRVDARLATDDAAIFAIGDCASFPCAFAGDRSGAPHVRLESVQNAVDHAKFVAGHLTGAPGVYEATPWFWSDQYDQKLQIAGLTGGADRRVRVDEDKPGLGVHCYAGARWLGFESVNRPADRSSRKRMRWWIACWRAAARSRW